MSFFPINFQPDTTVHKYHNKSTCNHHMMFPPAKVRPKEAYAWYRYTSSSTLYKRADTKQSHTTVGTYNTSKNIDPTHNSW